MPDPSGAFKGISLSGKAGDAWTRIFQDDSYHGRRLQRLLEEDDEFAETFKQQLACTYCTDPTACRSGGCAWAD